MSHQRPHREPGQMEVGIADVFLPHEQPQAAPRAEIPGWLNSWETHRPKALMECIAEFFGVLLYCWAGLGAGTCMFVHAAEKVEGFGGLINIAFSYTFGIMLAITICAPTSGGHLNPCITIAFAVFKGFPWRKVPQYIFSQIFGAFLGACLVYAQYAPELSKITKAMQEAGQEAAIFTPSGPAGAIALLPAPGSEIGIIFVNEFISTAIVGITVFSVLDPSNIFITPASSPIVISVVFFVIIICFGPNGVALNTARDLGGRLAAACFWGRGVFPAKYSALAVLTNIAGTLFGALFQVLFLSDTVRPPTSGALSVHRAMTAEKEGHMARIMTARENGIEPAFSRLGRIITPKTEAKGETQHIEKSMA